MENTILTAEEWLEKEEICGEWKSTSSPSLSTILERYANYKSRELQSKIIDFRIKMSLYTFLTIRDKYDKHFNITHAE